MAVIFIWLWGVILVQDSSQILTLGEAEAWPWPIGTFIISSFFVIALAMPDNPVSVLT